MTRSLIFLPLLALASCQTQTELSDQWNALPIVDRIEVEYRGSLYSGASHDVEIPEFEAVEIDENEPTPVWMIESAVLSMDEVAAARLLGDASVPQGDHLSAAIVDREVLAQTLDALRESGDGVQLSGPKLSVYETQRATLLIANQKSFIGHFEIERSPDAMLLDPVIGVFVDGLLVDVMVQGLGDSDQARLDFRLTMANLQKMEEVEAKAPVGGQKLTIQVPVFLRQDVTGQWRVNEDQAVVLPVLLGEDGQRLVVSLALKKSEQVALSPAERRESRQDLQEKVDAWLEAEAERIRLDDGR